MKVLKKQNFQPGLLGMIVNPVYIARRGLYKAIQQMAPKIEGDVLDFGCGSKPYENLFSHAKKYVGCDIKTSGHDHTESKIDFFYDGNKVPFRDGEFDAVVSFETFEHIFNLPDILKELNRVTKKSGYLLLTIPFAWEEHESPYDFARYTSFGITDLLNKSGYQVVELIKTTTTLLAVAQTGISYLHLYVSPRNKLNILTRMIIIFPLTVMAYVLNALLPKRSEYFSNSVVLARKLN